MFNSLKECSKSSELEDSLAEMLINLVKLRNSNWGHSPPSSIQVLIYLIYLVDTTFMCMALVSGFEFFQTIRSNSGPHTQNADSKHGGVFI